MFNQQTGKYEPLDPTDTAEYAIADGERENRYLYGQNDPPANIPATEKLSTSAELEAACLKTGWTITRGGQ